jgi:hypothetical protein
MKKLLLVIALIVAASAAYYFASSRTSENPVGNNAVEEPSKKAAPGYGADEAAIRAALIGGWKSTDDANFTRGFSEDNGYVDRYAGDIAATDTGVWSTFTATNPDPEFTGEVASDTTYLKLTSLKSNESYYYTVVKAIDNELVLTYLDRGNTLTFTRSQ